MSTKINDILKPITLLSPNANLLPILTKIKEKETYEPEKARMPAVKRPPN